MQYKKSYLTFELRPLWVALFSSRNVSILISVPHLPLVHITKFSVDTTSSLISRSHLVFLSAINGGKLLTRKAIMCNIMSTCLYRLCSKNRSIPKVFILATEGKKFQIQQPFGKLRYQFQSEAHMVPKFECRFGSNSSNSYFSWVTYLGKSYRWPISLQRSLLKAKLTTKKASQAPFLLQKFHEILIFLW